MNNNELINLRNMQTKKLKPSEPESDVDLDSLYLEHSLMQNDIVSR
jgi:hypothetical protein